MNSRWNTSAFASCVCVFAVGLFFFLLHVKQSLKTTHKILDHSEKGEVSAMINRKDLLEKIVFESSGSIECKWRETWKHALRKNSPGDEKTQGRKDAFIRSSTQKGDDRSRSPQSAEAETYTTLTFGHRGPFFGIFNQKGLELCFITTFPLKMCNF